MGFYLHLFGNAIQTIMAFGHELLFVVAHKLVIVKIVLHRPNYVLNIRNTNKIIPKIWCTEIILNKFLQN